MNIDLNRFLIWLQIAEAGMKAPILRITLFCSHRAAMRMSRMKVFMLFGSLGATSQNADLITADITSLDKIVRGTVFKMFGDNQCLLRSLVLQSMLTSRGVTASLKIGVDCKAEFSAHAWIEVNGKPTNDRDTSPNEFTTFKGFSL